jgi:hypothetical protein
MKKVISLFTVLVTTMVLLVSVASAQSNLPGGGWWSGEQVQNVGTADATVIVTAYDKSSTNTYTAQQTIAPGAAYTFVPDSFTGMPSGFQGSAVVSSDQPIKAIVNVTNRQSGSYGVTGGKAAAQYQGIDSSMVANTLYFPLAKGNHFNKTTTFYIQNAGTSAATATATFRMRNGDVHVYTTPSIGPNQMVVFSVLDAPTYNPNNPNNNARVGGLEVTSSQPLAGVVMEHYTTENPATIAQSTRGFTSADFDTTAYAPVIKHNRFGRFTGIQVQNVSSGPINITVTYLGSAGACAGNTYTDSATNVPSGASYTFVQYEGSTNLPANCTASATIVGTGNIVAIVNESYRSDSIPASGQSAVTSSALPAHSATTKISVPLFKDDRLGKRTGLQIQNVGTVQATNIVATFACSGAATFTAVSKPQTVAAGGAVLFYTPSDDPGMFTTANPFSSNNVNCAVTVTSDQPVVAIANESVIPGGALQQDSNNYEGFNLTP